MTQFGSVSYIRFSGICFTVGKCRSSFHFETVLYFVCNLACIQLVSELFVFSA
jgi:hypothetical protein